MSTLPRTFTHAPDSLAIYPEQYQPVKIDQYTQNSWLEGRNGTHAGVPTPKQNAAKIVSPLPYPSASYMYGAKSGKPNPASERKQDTAARAKQ